MARCRPAARRSALRGAGSAASNIAPAARDTLQSLVEASRPLFAEPRAAAARRDDPSPLALLSERELLVLQRLIDVVDVYVSSDVCDLAAAVELLSVADYRTTLLSLLAVAARHPSADPRSSADHPPSDVTPTYDMRVTDIVCMLLSTHLCGDSVPPSFRAFTLQALRTQTLHAFSRQLAAAAPDVPKAVPAQPEEQDQTQEQRPDVGGPEDAPNMQPASALRTNVSIAAVCVLIQTLLDAYRSDVNASPMPPNVLAVPLELAAALQESGVLEQAARALLIAAPAAARDGVSCGYASKAALVFGTVCKQILLTCKQLTVLGNSIAEPAAAAAADAAELLRAAVSGPCVRHAVLCLGVASLCAADGGSACGLPPRLVAPLLTIAADRARQKLDGTALEALAVTLGVQPTAAVAWPPGWRVSLALALRAGRVAVASAQAAAAVGSGGGSGSGSGSCGRDRAGAGGPGDSGGGVRGSGDCRPRPGGGGSGTNAGFGSDGSNGNSSSVGVNSAEASAPQPLVPVDPGSIGSIALCVIGASMELLRAHRGSAHWPRGAAEWWRLVVAALRHALPYFLVRERQGVLACLTERARNGLEAWPGTLRRSPELTAALDGGLLPCLEYLLRRAGEAPHGPEADIVLGMLASDPWAYLAPLLAHGELRHGAALVATLGKLLRLTELLDFVAAAAAVENGALISFYVAIDFLLYASDSISPSPPEADNPDPGQQQLLLLLSYALCEWLPPLSRLAQRAVRLAEAAALRGSRGGQVTEALVAPFTPVLSWLPLLARRCLDDGAKSEGRSGAGAGCAGEVAGSEAAAGGGASSDAAGAEDGGVSGGDGGGSSCGRGNAGDGSWRQFVLERMGAVPLLDSALRLTARPEAAEMLQTEFLRSVVASCEAVAAVLQQLPLSDGAGSGADAAAVARGGGGDSAAVDGETAAGPGPTSAADAYRSGLPCWPPELLEAIAVTLRTAEGGTEAEATDADTAEALAAWLRRGSSAVAAASAIAGEAAGGVASDRETAAAAWPSADTIDIALAATLVPPSAACRLLPTCANPACVNLEGDSEAGLTLRLCSGCGVVRYCCRACQTAHWRAGHKQACGRKERG